jgi:hypothetical protein
MVSSVRRKSLLCHILWLALLAMAGLQNFREGTAVLPPADTESLTTPEFPKPDGPGLPVYEAAPAQTRLMEPLLTWTPYVFASHPITQRTTPLEQSVRGPPQER